MSFRKSLCARGRGEARNGELALGRWGPRPAGPDTWGRSFPLSPHSIPDVTEITAIRKGAPCASHQCSCPQEETLLSVLS